MDREVKGHAVITSPALPRINPEVAGEKAFHCMDAEEFESEHESLSVELIPNLKVKAQAPPSLFRCLSS